MKYRWGLLITFLCLAFLLRVWGLAYFLPYQSHPDENYYIDPVLNWYIKGKADPGLTPSIFGRLPFKYTLLAGYGLWFLFSPYHPSEQWFTAAWFFARFLSVAFGVLTVALAYPLGKRLYGVRGGLWAAISMAGLFLPVRESHFAVNDAYETFFVLLAVYLSVVLFWRRRWADFLLAGMAVGLAATSKLSGWFTIVALVAAYVLTFVNWGAPLAVKGITQVSRRKELKYIGVTFLAILSLLVLTSARSLKDLPGFVRMLINLLDSVPSFDTDNFKGLQMAPFSGWQFYLNVLGWGAGWLWIGVMLWAIVWVCWRRYRPGMVPVIFSLVFWGYIGGREYLFARFLLPAMPPLVIIAVGELSLLKLGAETGFLSLKMAVSLPKVWSNSSQKPGFFFKKHALSLLKWQRLMRPQPTFVLSLLLAMLLLAQSWITSIWFDHLLTLPDTRLEATNWIIKQFPSDTIVVDENYSVFPSTVFLNKHWPIQQIRLNELGPTRNNSDYYLAHKTDLIVLSNFVSARVRHNVNDETARLVQQAMLYQKAELIKMFNPYRTEAEANHWFYLDEVYGPAGETLFRKQPGPLIKIFRVSASTKIAHYH